MEYRAFGNRYMVRMDPGEEILTQVKALCEAENIRLGEFRALAAVNYLDLAVYDVGEKQYYSRKMDGAFEVTSLFGTISEKDGAVYLHAHLSATAADGSAVGGHLNAAVVSGTCEMILEPMDGHVGRRYDEATGLNVLEFD